MCWSKRAREGLVVVVVGGDQQSKQANQLNGPVGFVIRSRK
jgi:hypothetical protein